MATITGIIDEQFAVRVVGIFNHVSQGSTLPRIIQANLKTRSKISSEPTDMNLGIFTQASSKRMTELVVTKDIVDETHEVWTVSVVTRSTPDVDDEVTDLMLQCDHEAAELIIAPESIRRLGEVSLRPLVSEESTQDWSRNQESVMTIVRTDRDLTVTRDSDGLDELSTSSQVGKLSSLSKPTELDLETRVKVVRLREVLSNLSL